VISELAHVFTVFFAVLPVPSSLLYRSRAHPMLASARSAHQSAIQADLICEGSLHSTWSVPLFWRYNTASPRNAAMKE
jgi:hypothetical protein